MSEKTEMTDEEIVEKSAQEWAAAALMQRRKEKLEARIKDRFKELTTAVGEEEKTEAQIIAAVADQILASKIAEWRDARAKEMVEGLFAKWLGERAPKGDGN